MDRFNKYLESQGRGSMSALADEVGCRHSHLSALKRNAFRRPSLELAFAIEDATSGEVPARSWLERQP
jgi:DNA-binding transcriptional regulator YdaS (Cro superfamily)